MAVGAQMKIAHKFRSAEHISRRELEKVLKGSLGTGFEVDPAEIEVMITGIMKVCICKSSVIYKIYIAITAEYC